MNQGDGIQIPIITTADTSGAKQQAQALGQVKQAADDLEKSLKRISQANEESALASKEKAKADKEIAAGVKVVSQEEVKAALAAKESDAKAFTSKSELRKAVKGLRDEFPMLAHVARMAINPITIIVAAAAGAFQLFKYRVDALAESMARMQLPDIDAQSVSRVSSLAEAYAGVNKAITEAIEKYHSVDQEHERFIKRLTDELGYQKQLLAAEKAKDLAALEGKRGSISDEEFARRKAGIESAYAAAGLGASQQTDAQLLAEREKRRDDLIASSRAKLGAAAAIHLPSEGDKFREDEIQKEFDKQKTTAQEAIKNAREALAEIAKTEETANNPLFAYRNAMFRARYGAVSYGEARQIEYGSIDNAQTVLDRYNAREHAKFARDQSRQRRAQLEAEAQSEAAEAAGIDAALPEERRAAARKRQVENQTASAEESRRGIELANQQKGTPLGQNILRAAQLAAQIQTKQRSLTSLTPEETQFLASMDMGFTGMRGFGNVRRATQAFLGADSDDPTRFNQVFTRMQGVATIKQDEAVAGAIRGGQKVDDASKEMLRQHVSMLTGVQVTVETAVKYMAAVQGKLEAQNAAIEQLQRRLASLDSRSRVTMGGN